MDTNSDIREAKEMNIFYIGRHGRAQGAKRSRPAFVGRVARIRQDIDTEELEFLIDIESGDEESLVGEKLYIVCRGSLGIVLWEISRNIENIAQMAIRRRRCSELSDTENEADLRHSAYLIDIHKKVRAWEKRGRRVSNDKTQRAFMSKYDAPRDKCGCIELLVLRRGDTEAGGMNSHGAKRKLEVDIE